jgi:hypothetical protein
LGSVTARGGFGDGGTDLGVLTLVDALIALILEQVIELFAVEVDAPVRGAAALKGVADGIGIGEIGADLD